MRKCGSGDDVCCYIDGELCRYAQPSKRKGKKWDCGLRVKYRSWKKAHASEEYLRDVRPAWDRAGLKEDCGDWVPRRDCPLCGEKAR